MKLSSSVFTFFQKLGKSLVLPIAILPVAGLALRLGQPDMFNIPVLASTGQIIFDNLASFFAIGIAIGFSIDGSGVAALSGMVAYLALTTVLKVLGEKHGVKLDMGVLAGVISGIIGGTCYNRFHKIKLPRCLGFFGGRRFVPIVSLFVAFITGYIFSYLWQPIQALIQMVGNWMVTSGGLGATVFGVINRLLLPFGGHHIINTICWFQFGDFTNAAGAVFHGDLNRFFAGDPTAGTFMTGFFPVMMFGLPGAALAMYLIAKKENKQTTGGLLFSVAFTAFLTGITEPIEFSFMFLAPVLYIFHALFTGAAMGICALLGYKTGFTFSGGCIDLLLSWGISTKPAFILILGPLFFLLYFVVFYFGCKLFKINPGKEETADDSESGKGAAAVAGDEYEIAGAKYIIACGGIENIQVVDNCATRLRMQINDISKIDEKAIRKAGASGVMKMGGNNLQIIVGTSVEFVADAMKNYMKSGKLPDFMAESAKTETADSTTAKAFELTVSSPVAGKALSLADVPDEAFAERMAGDGMAVQPEGDTFCAPISGRIQTLPKTCHAFVIKDIDAEVEVLVHVGIDTVNLKGEGFTALASVGDMVKAGTPIVKVDWNKVAPRAKSSISPVVITTVAKIAGINQLVQPGSQVAAGTSLYSAKNAGAQASKTDASAEEFVMDAEITDPNGIHVRPAAKLAKLLAGFAGELYLCKDEKRASIRNISELMNLGITEPARIQIVAKGTGAEAAAKTIADALKQGLDANAGAEAKAMSFVGQPTFDASKNAYSGLPASAGIGLAPLFAMPEDASEMEYKATASADAEKAALDKATQAAIQELQELSNNLRQEKQNNSAEVFEAHIEIIRASFDTACQMIADGRNACEAWKAVCGEQAAKLANAGNERLAGRAADYRDIEQRVLDKLNNKKTAVIYPEGTFILVAKNLTPGQMAALPKDRLSGVVLAEGSLTDHAAILARSFGIPTVVAAGDKVLALASGSPAIINGTSGFLEVNPDAAIQEKAEAAMAAIKQIREKEESGKFQAAVSADGKAIAVAANITGAEDAIAAVNNGADGVGLLRTELLVQNYAKAPTEDELYREFAAIAKAMNGREIIVRTYDIGGDKPVKFMPQDVEANPFLGIRGIRLCFEYPEVFRTQLRALLRAIRDEKLAAKIMFPMVSMPDEFIKAKGMVVEEAEKLQMAVPEIGMMIEVPSAVFLMDRFAEISDFFSIGTNDLAQYILAMDRKNPKLAKQADALDPAVLSAIWISVKCAHARGKKIGVCGNMASDPIGALVLFAMDVDELSVGCSLVGNIKEQIRQSTHADLKKQLELAMQCATAEDVRKLFS